MDDIRSKLVTSPVDTLTPANLELVVRVLESLFKDNSLDQTLARWENYASLTPDKAQAILIAFEDLIAYPVPDLRELLLEHGWVNLFHENEGNPVLYSQAEHLEWLRNTTNELRRIYKNCQASDR